MYHSRVLRLTVATALSVSIIGIPGCSDDSNPLAAAKEMVGAHAGPNTAITVANAAAAVDSLMSPIGDGILSVLVLADSNLAKPSRGGAAVTADIDPVVLQGSDISSEGNGSGTMSLISGSVTTDLNTTTGAGKMKIEMDVELEDFSLDGELFIGGSHGTAVTITFLAGMEMAGGIFVIAADIAAAGTLSGALSMDLTSTMTGKNDVTTVGTAIVDGTPVAINITDF